MAAGVIFFMTVLRANNSPGATYGQIPSWIPKAKVPVGRVVVASPAHPWHAIQGDTVAVHLGHARLMATVVGPAVPEEGRFPVPETSKCTFAVTLTDTRGTVPIDAGEFTTIDELGRLHHPRLLSATAGTAPRVLNQGETIRLRVEAILPTGNGQLRWAPNGQPIVSWDFDVEID